MKRVRLKNFIQKYHLAGGINAVWWVVKGNKVSTSCVSEDRSLIAFVSLDDCEMDDANFGIYDTAQLLRIVNMLDSDIDVELRRVDERPIALKLTDNVIYANFTLSEKSVIPKSPAKDELPEVWDATVKLNSDVMDRFIGAVNALKQSDSFTLLYDKAHDTTQLVVGHSNVNTNTISIDVDVEYRNGPIEPMPFSAKYLKEIISANRESDEIVLNVSSHGLANVSFNELDFKSDYFLIEVDDE